MRVDMEEKRERYHAIRDQISGVDQMMRKMLEVLPKALLPLKVEMCASQVPKLIESCKELKELALQRDVSPKPSRPQAAQGVIEINR